MTMACIKEAIGLFQSNTCGAVVIAAASFVAGMVASCALCRLFKPCSCKNGAAGKDQSKRAQNAEAKSERRRPAPADGSIEIYVGNLSYDLTDDQLRKEFEAYGKVNSARIITNRFNGKSKGFGFVHMPNRAEVDAAVAALNGKDILGRKLRCNEAKNVD